MRYSETRRRDPIVEAVALHRINFNYYTNTRILQMNIVYDGLSVFKVNVVCRNGRWSNEIRKQLINFRFSKPCYLTIRSNKTSREGQLENLYYPLSKLFDLNNRKLLGYRWDSTVLYVIRIVARKTKINDEDALSRNQVFG